MPNQTQLTEQQLKQVKYVSLVDYMRRVDQLEDFQDKMAFTTAYLLAHGMEQNRDYSFAVVYHVAQLKIAEASADLRKDALYVQKYTVNPFDKDHDAENNKFFARPTQYLKEQVAKRLESLAAQGPDPRDQQLVEKYQLMHAYLTNDVDERLDADIYALGFPSAKSTYRDMKLRFKNVFGSTKQLEDAYNATKPGILAKAFGKYSKAYANLDESYKAFNNPKHALYGNIAAIDKAATEYLQHCFPSWNPKLSEFPENAIEQLSGTRKERASFSLKLLKACAEQRKAESVYQTILEGSREKMAEIEAGVYEEIPQHEPGNLEQDFQNAVKVVIDNEEQVNQPQQEEKYESPFAQIDDAEMEA